MYFADNLLLLEMPKAGSTFMRRFLELYYGRENIRKVGIHNGVDKYALKEKIVNGELIVLSTIRNPFDWYVSMFAWNSMGKGVYRDIGFKRFELSMEGVKSIVKNPMILFRDLTQWQKVFQDPKSPELFQEWLKLLLQKQPHYIERRFGKIGEYLGFFTYRFLKIHTYNFYKNYTQLRSAESIKPFYDSNKIPVVFLKTESLTDDLLNNANKLGLEEKRINKVLEIMTKKRMMRANSTERLPYSSYYNQEAIDLIYNKDSFLINKFNYAF